MGNVICFRKAHLIQALINSTAGRIKDEALKTSLVERLKHTYAAYELPKLEKLHAVIEKEKAHQIKRGYRPRR